MQNSGKTSVKMKTSMGDVTIKLYDKESPETVKNFLQYVDDQFYDNTIFHRVIGNFMIQGGGFSPGMEEKKTREPVKNEADNGLSNKKGTIAMARTQEVDSATAQFFINVKDNEFLDHGERDFGYCVFGEVVDGYDVVEKIKDVKTQTREYFQNVPVDDVIIFSICRADTESSK